MVSTNRQQSPPFPDQLNAAKAGAEWAWELIYRNLSGPVTGYLAARRAPDPEDLTAEVFLQVARDIHRFEGDEGSFRSWVFVIAHRRLLDARRSAARQPKIIDIDRTNESTFAGGDVESDAFEDIALQWVRDALDQLTEEQRNVLLLRVVADLSLQETAHVMNKRVGAIKALQRRGLAAVRAHIDEGRVTL
jgi:RNA polymerase sigma-70 factor (ECF subfamily)